MAPLIPLSVVTISPNPPVFDLPVLVAQSEGIFADLGLEVRFSADYEKRSPTERDVISRLKEAHFEEARADVFNVFNHPSFNGVDLGFQSPTFGQVVGTLSPRILQLALDLTF